VFDGKAHTWPRTQDSWRGEELIGQFRHLKGRRSTPSGAETRTGFPLPPPIVFGYTQQYAAVVVEGAPV
jgi:hypothetical protein